jgi:hypothetical protein
VPEVHGFSANDVHRISAAVRAYESGRLTQHDLQPEHLQDRNYGKIAFRNDSGEAVPAHAVMRVTGMATVERKNLFTISKPNTTFGRLYLVNGPTGVAIGKRGWGTWLWHADHVLYDTANTPAYGESWGPQNNTWTIKKNHVGFLIAGGNTGTGAASRTIAMQELTTAAFGKADAAIASGASGTVRVYGGTQGSEVDTSQTIPSCWNEGAALVDEADLKVRWLHGNPYIEQFTGGSTEIYRGVTDAAIAKGASGTVSRYTAAGVDTTTNDTVTNLFADVAISMKVIYVKIETTFFMIAAEC